MTVSAAIDSPLLSPTERRGLIDVRKLAHAISDHRRRHSRDPSEMEMAAALGWDRGKVVTLWLAAEQMNWRGEHR